VNLALQPLFVSLTPVFLLIALGYLAGRRDWIRESALKDLSNLVFMILIPALLFRTMSSVHLQDVDPRPLLAYFPVVLLVFFAVLAWRGFHRESAVVAMASVFSNMVMVGIALVELAYGRAALVTLITLISVHAFILLSVGAVVLELAVAREARLRGDNSSNLWATLGSVMKSTLVHPVPLPILCGLLFAQAGWSMPVVLDKPLQLLGSAFGPIALLLVGVSLARTPMAGHWRRAFQVSLIKLLLLPVLVGLAAWAMGISGLPLTVMVVAAALPVGANVYLFAQRYETAQALTTATMGVSTAISLFTLSGVMLLMAWLNPVAGA
jgi:malonate transporter